VLDFPVEDLGAEDVARLRGLYEPLTKAVRELIDATIRTEADGDAVAAAKAEIDSATARLRSRQLAGAYGVRFGSDGDQMAWGNAVVGLRNPVAPPLELTRWPKAFSSGRAGRGDPDQAAGDVADLGDQHPTGGVVMAESVGGFPDALLGGGQAVIVDAPRRSRRRGSTAQRLDVLVDRHHELTAQSG
jgi:hypothetical protein